MYEKKTLVKVGALWINAAESSRASMPCKGTLGGRDVQIKVLMFKVREKKNERAPDYELVIEAEGNEALLKFLGIAPKVAAPADHPTEPRMSQSDNAEFVAGDEDVPFTVLIAPLAAALLGVIA